MKFCSLCGTTMIQHILDGDSRLHCVCDACHTVHYQNPHIVADGLPVWDGRVLLYRRAIAPRLGYQTLPTGFMENGETLAQAAAREAEEGTNARVDDLQLHTLFDLPRISQIYLFFHAELLDLDFSTGDESLEIRLFNEVEIPWSKLAFPTIGRTLGCYFDDRRESCFPVHSEAIAPMLASYKKDWTPNTRAPSPLRLKGTSGISLPCAGCLLYCA